MIHAVQSQGLIEEELQVEKQICRTWNAFRQQRPG